MKVFVEIKCIKLFLAFLIVTFSINSYSQSNSKNTNIKLINGNKLVIFNYDSLSLDDKVFKDAKSTSLTVDELKLTQTILLNFIDTYNIGAEKEYIEYKKKHPKSKVGKYAFLIKFNGKYIQQLVPVMNKNNEKEVWINCFYIAQFNKEDLMYLYWENKIVSYLGGGKYFFNLKINLSTRKYYDAFVNDTE